MTTAATRAPAARVRPAAQARTPDAPAPRNRIRSRQAERPRPLPRRHVASLPFLALVAGLLGAGLIGLLLINNSLAAGSFEAARLKSDRILLGEQEQALRQEVERLSSPTRVREAARQAGMIAAATTAYFDVTTGEIFGVPQPAGAGGVPGTAGAPTLDPAVIDPATGLPLDPAATGSPAATDPATGLPLDPVTGLPADPADGTAATPTEPAPTDSAARGGATDPDATAPTDPEADGAVVGGPGVTAYDRAIVSGGGR